MYIPPWGFESLDWIKIQHALKTTKTNQNPRLEYIKNRGVSAEESCAQNVRKKRQYKPSKCRSYVIEGLRPHNFDGNK